MRPLITCLLVALAPIASADVYITVIQGLGGTPAFSERFDGERHLLEQASLSLTPEDKLFSFRAENANKDELLAHFKSLQQRLSDADRAIIYLVGHGSFDGKEYKFNIPGPDLTDADLDNILETLPGNNHLLVNTSSTSGAILEKLEKEGRLLITATRNGNERNATFFGGYFAAALSKTEADLNKNDSISAQEAFDYALRGVSDFFEEDGKLATEHAQLRGEGAEKLNLARLSADTGGEVSQDPEIAALIQQRQALDRDIEELQLRRDQMDSNDYLAQFQALILESARLTEAIEQAQDGSQDGN